MDVVFRGGIVSNPQLGLVNGISECDPPERERTRQCRPRAATDQLLKKSPNR
jgi:hypothetical protein